MPTCCLWQSVAYVLSILVLGQCSVVALARYSVFSFVCQMLKSVWGCISPASTPTYKRFMDLKIFCYEYFIEQMLRSIACLDGPCISNILVHISFS
jgi:hypothetical protein